MVSVLIEPSASRAPSTAPDDDTVVDEGGSGTLVTEIDAARVLPSFPVTVASSVSGPAAWSRATRNTRNPSAAVVSPPRSAAPALKSTRATSSGCSGWTENQVTPAIELPPAGLLMVNAGPAPGTGGVSDAPHPSAMTIEPAMPARKCPIPGGEANPAPTLSPRSAGT